VKGADHETWPRAVAFPPAFGVSLAIHRCSAERVFMSPATIELIGSVAAIITTLCWVPQAIKVIRTRDTAAISLIMYLMLIIGIGLWLAYGVLIMSWPLIGANAVTFVLVLIILAMKLRFG
jgi:MtN3 and saliva related transmembrane protein